MPKGTTMKDDDRDPYAEGKDAYLAGKDESANPYDPASDELANMEWNDGWADAEGEGED